MEVGLAGNEMAKDPFRVEKHFIPQNNNILYHTKLLGNRTPARYCVSKRRNNPGSTHMYALSQGIGSS